MNSATRTTAWLAATLVVLHSIGTALLIAVMWQQMRSGTELSESSYLRLVAQNMCRGTARSDTRTTR